jgi:hypothetical protein
MAMSNTLNPVASQAPAGGTGASLILAAPTDGTRWILKYIVWSYAAAPTAPTLTIQWTIGATTYTETYYVAAVAGQQQLTFPEGGKMFPANTQVTITMTTSGVIANTMYPWAYTGNG